jgi:nucleoside-diphosphate-sugar epimerase
MISRSDVALTLLGRRNRNGLQEKSQSLQNARLNYLQVDLADPFDDRLLEGVECVIHLAGVLRFEGEQALRKNNILATRQLAQACLRKKKRFIFISTASVYGVPSVRDHESAGEISQLLCCPYAVSKRVSELEIVELVGMGLDATIFRFGQVYGYSNPMQYHTMLHAFLLRACSSQPIRVWENATYQVRPYLHLSDAVSVIEFLVARPLPGLHIFDCASQNLSTEDVIHRIAKVVPNVSIEFIEPPFGGVDSIELSCENIKNLGFEFRGNIDGAILEIIENSLSS